MATPVSLPALGESVTEGTVKSHLKRILRKLHVTNRAEAVAKYLHILRLDEDAC